MASFFSMFMRWSTLFTFSHKGKGAVPDSPWCCWNSMLAAKQQHMSNVLRRFTTTRTCCRYCWRCCKKNVRNKWRNPAGYLTKLKKLHQSYEKYLLEKVDLCTAFEDKFMLIQPWSTFCIEVCRHSVHHVERLSLLVSSNRNHFSFYKPPRKHPRCLFSVCVKLQTPEKCSAWKNAQPGKWIVS